MNTTWQPIETAPKDGRDVLLFIPKSKDTHMETQGVCCWGDGKWIGGFSKDGAPKYLCGSPSHWMHLPLPPKP